VVLN
jgi:hypothetical protein